MKLASLLTLLAVVAARRRRDGGRGRGGKDGRRGLNAFNACRRYSDCDAEIYGEGGCCLLEEETVAYVKLISTQ